MKDEYQLSDEGTVAEATQGAPLRGPRHAPTPILISPRTRNLLIGAFVVALVDHLDGGVPLGEQQRQKRVSGSRQTTRGSD
jgi:hypothetical protein